MESWVINLLTVGGSVFAAAAVAKYRIDRLEKDQEKHAENLSTALSQLGDRLNASDERARTTSARLFQRSDENRQAGGILESRLSAVETIMDPTRIHEFNKDSGAQAARLSRTEQDIARLEKYFIEHLQYDRNK